MAQSVCGISASTACFDAMTSCTNSTPSHCASSMPPEPVMETRIGTLPRARSAFWNTCFAVAFTSVWWRS